MISTVILDDEPMARDAILALLERYCPEIEVIGVAGDIESGVRLIRQNKPELLILDIHLTDGTSFDLLERLGNDQYKIIFITAFEEYAITAFKFSAMDYILNPVNPDELVAAINKVHDSLDKESMTRRLEILFESLRTKSGEGRKIALRTSSSVHIVDLSDIIRCQSEKNYTQFFLAAGEPIVVSKTLKEFEELLVPFQFVRVHQSHLVNLDHIRKYEKSEGGILIMSDHSQVPVSLRKKEDLMKVFGQLKY
jgi:two-component system, LytTR family, response regulator